MATVEEKREELADIEAVHFISSALLEISASDLQQLRSKLQENAQYYDEIADLYAHVKQSALRRGHLADTGAPSRKVDTLSVAFTSNRRFYGAINHEIVAYFVRDMQDTATDCMVIGTTGHAIAQHRAGMPACRFHDFTSDEPSTEELRAFLKQVSVYRRIFVYYPKFRNVFQQEVEKLDITYTPSQPVGGEGSSAESVDYIFEPELPQLLEFFEQRVRFLLFRRVMLETRLARAAARFVAMSSAERQSEETADKLSRLITRLEDAQANRELLESLTGFAKFAQWKQQL